MKKLITKIYENLASLRRKLYKAGILKTKRLEIPVISIGNLSFGGTGKTPVTIETAKYFKQKGLKPCVLSRGYKRKSKGIIIVSDGEKIFVDVKTAGDEPYLIAKAGIPVVVGENRYKAGLKALEEIKPDIFILDDGFQHYQLERDINILVIDATQPFWKDEPFPSGRLREPRSFNKYADAFVITKTFLLSEEEKKELLLHLNRYTKPFFVVKEEFNRLTDGNLEYNFDIMVNVDIGVFAGLGNNQQFFKYMLDCAKKCGFKIKYTKSFPDHYDYEDLKLNEDVDFWITTYKDFIKIPPEVRKKYNIFALIYDLKLPEDYFEYLEKKLYIRKGFKIPNSKVIP
ncbi:MAG: tetraacyldisaccharide 4'-kinase [Aquificae bacterium]|nr:tetraacyldisaccharide 4'-kinase [Aquificota bacterium]